MECPHEKPILISDPKAIKTLLTDPEHGHPLSHLTSLGPVLGPYSLSILEGSEHLARRKLMLPLFHGRRMRACQPIIEGLVAGEIDAWPLGEEFAMQPRMEAVSLEVILRVVFGVGEGPRLERLRPLLTEVLAETASLPLGGHGDRAQLEDLLKAADELLYAEISERRSEEDLEERGDVLSALMLARFEDGEPMSDAELRDQLMTLLLAGHETTATALAWTFDLLLRHPRELRRLRASLARGEDDYLRATVRESLRVRPVVPITGRRLSKEIVLEGRTLRAETDVMSAIWLTHTRADIYPEPSTFRPERFLDDGPEAFAWIPFGGGVHRCMGGSFAEFEVQIVLREVLARCELRKADPAPEKVARRLVTLSPRGGTPVVLTERRPT